MTVVESAEHAVVSVQPSNRLVRMWTETVADDVSLEAIEEFEAPRPPTGTFAVCPWTTDEHPPAVVDEVDAAAPRRERRITSTSGWAVVVENPMIARDLATAAPPRDVDAAPPSGVVNDLAKPTGHDPVRKSGDWKMANNMNAVLNELQEVEGFIAAAIADSASGMALGKIGGGASFNVELAAAANTEVVKAKLRAMKSLKLDDSIEDMLITLGTQYHLLRPLRKRPEIFFYVALDRRRANLAVARFALADAEEKLVL